MPDFEALVRQRLGSLGLSRDCEREVIAELAAHLEDHYELLIQQGSRSSVALAEVLRSLGNSRALRRRVVRAKEDDMIARHKIMGPGVIALLLSGSIQGLIYLATSHSIAGWWFTTWWIHETAVTVEFPWILSLLLVGAIAAWTGRKVGAKPAHRLIAATFPALGLGALCVLGGSASLIVDWSRVHHSLMLQSLALYMAGWVLLPALAGALGALPFLRGEGSQEPKSPTATAATA